MAKLGQSRIYSHRRDICLTKVKLNPDPSAASGTENLRRNTLCAMYRSWGWGAEPQFLVFGEPGTHIGIAVHMKVTE